MSLTLTRISDSGTRSARCLSRLNMHAAFTARSSKSRRRSVFGWNTSTCGSSCPTTKCSVTSRSESSPCGPRMRMYKPSSDLIRRWNMGARNNVVSNASCGCPGGSSLMNGDDASGRRSTTWRVPPCVSARPVVSPCVFRR
eukprot:29661-Pelagococcus_subviridis.AAC.4